MSESGTPKRLALRETSIPGLVLVDLPVHVDRRGWFKENWQRAKMLEVGLPDFGPVQNNVSFNGAVGTTRGIHAEPWDKFVSIAAGSVFGAWVDLREGPTFGTTFTAVIDVATAIFVPRGVGNSYQTLQDDTAYSYLVNEHWSAGAEAEYTFLNLADPTAGVDWPIPLDRAEISEKDKGHPFLEAVAPIRARKTLVLGANGQLGRALREALPAADFATRDSVDVNDPASLASVRWSDYDTVINAAAYTKVDDAETESGRARAWATNVTAVGHLARIATEFRLTLVHISSDYVFDGTRDQHREDEALTPLGVYGQTKAAGDAVVGLVPRHYLLRTSWVIGDGANFVRTMASLAERGIDPQVVDDQTGRLSFTADIAAAIAHLLQSGAPYGTYNVSNGGPAMSWAEIARIVFELRGHDPARIKGVPTAEYFRDKQAAPRPLRSTLDLEKLAQAGFVPRDARVALKKYLAESARR